MAISETRLIKKRILIIYEDQDILVIDKPSGITVNKSDTTKEEETVQDFAQKYLKITKGAEVAHKNFRVRNARQKLFVNSLRENASANSENFESSPRSNGQSSVVNDKYFLIVSRLVPYKKIDLAVKVFNKLGLPLKIVGTGIEENRLKRMAKSNIELPGYLTDKELVGYYKGCRAFIFPGIEDFGLTVIEAHSFGKPVIAFKAGGVQESIIDGKTGIFFEVQSEKSLEDAILKFQKMNFNPQYSKKNAEKFSLEEFKTKLKKEISLVTSN